jgi:D-glycero-alpha-D-manno-heptose-7-phosphate kinase
MPDTPGQWHDISKELADSEIHSSAPCRVDCGGSTDHRLTGLLCRPWHPATATIALDLRASVRLSAHTAGLIAVESPTLGASEVEPPDVPLSGPLGIAFAVLAHYGLSGIRARIDTDVPLRSGLGGSGSFTVAMIGALEAAANGRRGAALERPDIVRLAHHIEDALRGGTGLQDQAAAAYGGVRLWEWRYGGRLDFVGSELTTRLNDLEQRLLVAYSGHPHPPTDHGVSVLTTVKKTGQLGLVGRVSGVARRFAAAISAGKYVEAGHALSEEGRLRGLLLPDLIPAADGVLIDAAERAGCGVRFAGRGGGGCIWALGEVAPIQEVRARWEQIFQQRGSGQILPVRLATDGLRVETRQ